MSIREITVRPLLIFVDNSVSTIGYFTATFPGMNDTIVSCHTPMFVSILVLILMESYIFFVIIAISIIGPNPYWHQVGVEPNPLMSSINQCHLSLIIEYQYIPWRCVENYDVRLEVFLWLSWVELSWIELNWIELNWIELNWIELNWIELNWIELNWIELNRIELNWIDLIWLELNKWAIPRGKTRSRGLYTLNANPFSLSAPRWIYIHNYFHPLSSTF